VLGGVWGGDGEGDARRRLRRLDDLYVS
jgi:hypothetical protein